MVDLLPTRGPNTAGEIACDASKRGAAMIVAAGGDGTINEVVSGLAHTQTPLGILPAGTANVLAAEVGFSKDLAVAARQLCESRPCRIALGRVSADIENASPEIRKRGRYFLMMAGAGLDAAIIYELDLSLKQKLGKLAYWHGGFRQLGRNVARFHVEVSERDYLASFVLATRVRNYGGDFEIARKIKLTDNDFEIVVFQNNHWWGYLRFFVSVLLNRLHHSRDVTIHRSTELRLSAPEDHRIYVQADGESVGHLPCTVEIVPDALTLMLPSRYIQAGIT